MNEQLKCLIELQEIDSSILSLAEEIEVLPRTLNQYTPPLKAAKESYQKVSAGSDALKKKKKDKDMELDDLQDKINKLKSRSSDIKTNKEYEAHLKEIESFEKKAYRVEDEILSLMEEIEAFSKEMAGAEAEVKKAEEEFKEQEMKLQQKEQKLQAELEAQKEKRKAYAGRITEENYRRYMDLLKRAGGLAVVRTENEVCLGCNTNIPPQLYNEIKANDGIHTCYYCKRFLYYKEPEPAGDTSGETSPNS